MDQTEVVRRALVLAVNIDPGSREALEIEYGQVWNTRELSQDFDVKGFAAPFVMCSPEI